MPAQTKSGAKGQKIGRWSRGQSNKSYIHRAPVNKAKKAKKHAKYSAPKRLRVPHGTARALRRKGMGINLQAAA